MDLVDVGTEKISNGFNSNKIISRPTYRLFRQLVFVMTLVKSELLPFTLQTNTFSLVLAMLAVGTWSSDFPNVFA